MLTDDDQINRSPPKPTDEMDRYLSAWFATPGDIEDFIFFEGYSAGEE